MIELAGKVKRLRKEEEAVLIDMPVGSVVTFPDDKFKFVIVVTKKLKSLAQVVYITPEHKVGKSSVTYYRQGGAPRLVKVYHKGKHEKI